MVINITMMLWVIIDISIPSLEWIIEEINWYSSVSNRFFTNVNTTINLEVKVLLVVKIDSIWIFSSTKTSLLSVLMDIPHTINTLMDLVVKVVSRKQCGGHKPENNILRSQFKNG